MRLYLVRWPWLKASLVSARDEEDLLETLDEVDDSEGATWSVFRGPVWIDFDVPAEYRIEEKAPGAPLRSDEIVVEGVEKIDIGHFDISSPGCDTTFEMLEEVTKRAFPALHKLLYVYERDRPSKKELCRAVSEELQQLVNADWRRAHRAKRTDSIGLIAQQLGAPVRQVENILRSTGQLPGKPRNAPKGKLHKLKKKKPGPGNDDRGK